MCWLVDETSKSKRKCELVPRKVYLYRSIINSLTDLVKRPDFMMKN